MISPEVLREQARLNGLRRLRLDAAVRVCPGVRDHERNGLMWLVARFLVWWGRVRG